MENLILCGNRAYYDSSDDLDDIVTLSPWKASMKITYRKGYVSL